MHLQQLFLEQFRNYDRLHLQFDDQKQLTSFVGANAQGKTNVLEALYLLALSKSFRASKYSELIQWHREYAKVKGIFKENDQVFELEIFLGHPPHPQKSMKKNGVKVSTIDFIGFFQIVFFHPEDLNMLYLGPDLRRRYLDILNVQISMEYYRHLRSYKQLLDQRNALLKTIREGRAAKTYLEIWDDQLVDQGSYLISERAKTIDFLNHNISGYYQSISQGAELVQIKYKHALNQFEGSFTDVQAVKNAYRNSLEQAQNRDIQAEYTTRGPHRDDFEFFFNGRPLGSHASRGEYRSLLLSLKLLELKFYEEKTGHKPLLLLDDVFSELDTQRQKMLLQSIDGYQAILTATHNEPVFQSQYQIFTIAQGKIKK